MSEKAMLKLLHNLPTARCLIYTSSSERPLQTFATSNSVKRMTQRLFRRASNAYSIPTSTLHETPTISAHRYPHIHAPPPAPALAAEASRDAAQREPVSAATSWEHRAGCAMLRQRKVRPGNARVCWRAPRYAQGARGTTP